MPDQNQQPTDLHQTIQRCAAAYHRVRAELPPKEIGYRADALNQNKASLAYIAELPLLIDPAAFQLYIAGVAQGVGIGAIDLGDAGRLCHLAQTAMSAWKLINLIIPAAQAKEQKEAERKATPLPPKGNQSPVSGGNRAGSPSESKAKHPSSNGNHLQDDPNRWEKLYASTKLPDWERQKTLFASLRRRGVEIPTDEELRADPAQALHYVETARWYLRGENVSSAAAAQAQQPAQAQAQPKPSNQPA